MKTMIQITIAILLGTSSFAFANTRGSVGTPNVTGNTTPSNPTGEEPCPCNTDGSSILSAQEARAEAPLLNLLPPEAGNPGVVPTPVQGTDSNQGG